MLHDDSFYYLAITDSCLFFPVYFLAEHLSAAEHFLLLQHHNNNQLTVRVVNARIGFDALPFTLQGYIYLYRIYACKMFSAGVILGPRSELHPELQLQSRSLQDTVNSLPPKAVLVRAQVAGVCHTDLHLWHGYYKVASCWKHSWWQLFYFSGG